jgi:hypothetical protein
LVPRFGGARSGSPRLPFASSYGGQALVSTPIPGGSKAWTGSTLLAQRHHLLHANAALSYSFSALPRSTSGAWLRHEQNRNATVPQNKALHQTKGVGVPASQAVVEAPFAGERRCSAETTGCTAKAKDGGLVPRFAGARSGSPRLPFASSYGGQALVSTPIPGGSKAWTGSTLLAQRHHLLHANAAPSYSFSALPRSTSGPWLRHEQNRNATVPQNKALHQTKGVGVPASQAVVEAPFAGERRC